MSIINLDWVGEDSIMLYEYNVLQRCRNGMSSCLQHYDMLNQKVRKDVHSRDHLSSLLFQVGPPFCLAILNSFLLIHCVVFLFLFSFWCCFGVTNYCFKCYPTAFVTNMFLAYELKFITDCICDLHLYIFTKSLICILMGNFCILF